MVEQEDQRRKIIRIKRINPSSETQDGNTTDSTLEEDSILEVCKVYVPTPSVQLKTFSSRMLVISRMRNAR